VKLLLVIPNKLLVLRFQFVVELFKRQKRFLDLLSIQSTQERQATSANHSER